MKERTELKGSGVKKQRSAKMPWSEKREKPIMLLSTLQYLSLSQI